MAQTLADILNQKYDVSLPSVAYTHAGTGGQYGYVNGIPVLKASEADNIINSFGGYVTGDQAGKLDNAMGWDTGSTSGILTSGAGVFGLKKTPEIKGEGTEDGPYATGKYNYSGDFDAAAKQLGIDPNQFQDQYVDVEYGAGTEDGLRTRREVGVSKEEQLYNAINEKAKDFYLVAGKTGSGDINEQGERPAFATNTGGNHAVVLYKKEGDALVPIPQSVKYYNSEMQLSPSSWFKDISSTVAPIASIFATAYGNPMLAAGIQGTNSVIQGQSVLDAAKNAALTYGISQLMPTSLDNTNYLGSQALGDASTRAVGTGSTGFGINPSAAPIGISEAIGGNIFNANQLAEALKTPTISEAFTPIQLAEALSKSTPTTDYLGTQALGDATTGAVGSTATPSTLGEFNPANISNIGIQTPELSTLGSLGGTSAMDIGAAGLTAEQLANANAAAQIGSNSASGLGYLGGAESLPSGTAGITGVTPTTNWSDFSKSLGNLLGGNQQQNLANALYGGQVNVGGTNIPKSNQPAFSFTQQMPIQSTSTDKTASPYLTGNPQLLANLLKG